MKSFDIKIKALIEHSTDAHQLLAHFAGKHGWNKDAALYLSRAQAAKELLEEWECLTAKKRA